ncbi:hypothetical protein, partial [Streptomyces sp. AC154]|uniref:hypothetical protein n=1 Tax=Streptomyces sp. AC154 TaxID=3143184 RepID=UPI003F7E81E4
HGPPRSPRHRPRQRRPLTPGPAALPPEDDLTGDFEAIRAAARSCWIRRLRVKKPLPMMSTPSSPPRR